MSARIVLGTSLLFALAACTGGEGAGPAPGAAVPAAGPVEAAAGVCPPCRMAVQPRFERIEAGGLAFRVCNPRCAEIVREDPQAFAGDALP